MYVRIWKKKTLKPKALTFAIGDTTKKEKRANREIILYGPSNRDTIERDIAPRKVSKSRVWSIQFIQKKKWWRRCFLKRGSCNAFWNFIQRKLRTKEIIYSRFFPQAPWNSFRLLNMCILILNLVRRSIFLDRLFISPRFVKAYR